jgi:hypothetical protein
MSTKLNFYIDSNALIEIARITKEKPTKAEHAIQSFWLETFEKSSEPLSILLPDGIFHKNRALLDVEAHAQAMGEFAQATRRYETLLEEKTQQVVVLTRALSDLQNSVPAASTTEIQEKSLKLALWKSLSAKPGAFGFSIDLKAFVQETREILEERSRPISLNLNKKDDPSF